MPKMKDFSKKNEPRFLLRDKWIIYSLFDAFVETTLIGNRAIDFSIAPTIDSERIIHFDTLKNKFSDLLNLEINLLRAGEKSFYNEKIILSKIADFANSYEYNLLFAHFNWLWSLGFNECAIKSTTCGTYGQNIGIKNEKSLAFVEGGLWSPRKAAGRKPNDFLFMFEIFKQYMNASARAGDIHLAKRDLERITLEKYRFNSTPMANAILHYCNPNEHIHIFASDVKRQILEEAQENFELDSSIIISNGKIDNGTLLKDIDSEICRFFDSISPANYDELMRKYFYKDRQEA